MIVVGYGMDYVQNVSDVLGASDIGLYLRPDMDVAIKPNLVVPGPASNGATTHPEVVEGIILFLREFGVAKIKIIESSWVGDSTKRAFRDCGYEELSRRLDVPLIDLKSDGHSTLAHNGYEIHICDEALNSDFLINVPVLKAHCQTSLTCCMKNLKGCIPDSEKRRFHTLGIHEPVAVLNALLRCGYNVVDGICGDLTFEEGGNPVVSNRILAGRCPVLLDSYCAELIGYRPEEIGYLAHAAKLQIGEFYSDATPIIIQNADAKPLNNPAAAPPRFTSRIKEDAACSACYSALVYALQRHKTPPANLYIGQGFINKTGDGIGIGNCCAAFANHIPGCPPRAANIVEYLASH